eukprot:m.74024 g.74024  ORF g.74024 m.74024 type:complete len:339 (+) comp7752_c0_seq1:15-1031(+)
MAAHEGLRQRRRPGAESRPRAQSQSDEEDDEMLGTDAPLRRTMSTASLGNGELRSLYRYVNHYVTRYCVRIRDIFRNFMGGRAPQPAVPPTAQTRASLDILDTIQKTPFNPEIPEHEASLLELWTILGTGDAYERVGAHWGRLGFQGKDPATDFRGQGALGLRNMLHFARQHKEHALGMITDRDNVLPFAIAVINISAHLLILLNTHAGRLGNSLFEFTTTSDEALALFDSLFSLVFIEFMDFHRHAIHAFVASGGNAALAVMQFNPIRAKFFDTLSRQISDGSFMTSYVEQVSSAGISPSPYLPAPGPGQQPVPGQEILKPSAAPAEPAVGVLVDLN